VKNIMANKAYPPSICPGIPRLGKCPTGWSTCTFGDILTVVERPVPVDDDTVYQLVTAKRNRGGIVPREQLKGREIKTQGQYTVRAGDFLIANRQIIHGACGIVPQNLDGAIVSGEYTVLLPKDGLYLSWLAYYAHSVHFQQTCFQSSIGVDVEKMVFKVAWWMKQRLHVPPRSEQKKIAAILTTWDTAIGQTRALIKTDKRRKIALQQKLVSGVIRLSGFRGRWKPWSLTKACNIRFSGVDKKTVAAETTVQLCNYTDVYYNSTISANLNFMSATASMSEIDQFQLRKGDVLLTKDSETADDIAKCAVVTEDLPNVLCGYHLALIRPNDVADGAFLCQLLNSYEVRTSFSRFANGVTRFGLSSTVFDHVSIRLPQLSEQRAIAAVLTSADDEIRELEAKAEALERQKKGLMQKLLTGKVRVKTARKS
jgi:type I restriction enzyme S subunit